MGSYPLPALDIRPPQSPLEQYGQLANLASLRQRQALMPGQLQAQQLENQQRQQGIQSGALEIQQKQLDLQDRQGMSQALMDTYGTAKGSPTTADGSPAAAQNSSPSDRISDFVNRIQDPKYGISATGQIGMMEKFNALKDQLVKTDKDTIDAIQSAHKQISQGLNSVLEAPPEDQMAQWTLERNALMRDPTLSKYAAAISQQYPGTPAPGGSPEAQRMLHGLMAEQDLVASIKEKAELPGQIAASQKAQQAIIPPGGGISPEAQQQLKLDIAKETNPEIQAGKVAVARAEGQAHAQVQMAMEPLRLQIQQQFGNQKDARDKIETNVLKPYQDKITDVTMARNAIAQAATNPLSARAAVFKMVGVAQPAGSHRVLPMEFTAFKYPGGIGTQAVEHFNDWLKGAPWTPEISQAANAFIDGQAQAAQQNLNSGVDNVNKLYGTSVGGGLKSAGAGPVSVTDPRGVTHTFPDQKSADAFKSAAGIK